jgi:hypothetical protein
MMAKAKEALDELSQDPAVHRMARERADAIKLYELDLAACRADGRVEGLADGRAEGEAKLLLKLLGVRFGPLSDVTRARVQAATVEQLETWGERILSAATLDDVLAP